MCGIFGISNHKDAAKLAYLGLYALQHRGEESAGIVVRNGKNLIYHKGMGLVNDIFNENQLKQLRGDLAIAHNRYSTTGSSSVKNIQPFFVKHRKRSIAIAHNGNLTNVFKLKSNLEKKGSIFQSTMDSEIIAHLLASPEKKSVEESVVWTLAHLEGAYSLALMVDDLLIGARDPYGWRPLCLGKLDGAFVLASETCALDLIQAEYVRDIEPGEIIFINKDKIESTKLPKKNKHAFCIFEYIYFSRPDSNIFGKNAYQARRKLGVELAKEHPVDSDLVTPVPDSGVYASIGYAEESGIPFEMGIIRNHYVGRTFIQPSQFIRDFKVKVKLNPIKDVLKGKRVVVVEDSIVRGTTSKARVKSLREAGAKEIHMRISCPPLRYPCFYGIDFPSKKELIASKHSINWIRDFLGVDSLEYLSLEGMLKSMPLAAEEFCTACFTGKYPTKLSKKLGKNILEER
ncbi:MAG: amidophosphoribosyltransferase [Candidatus Omnitrophica bacterium]|nr:amidophosphoribosyltransferase [Candidatus Omnitrophota bacterium]